MITNVQTGLTYSTLAAAVAALPTPFTMDYELTVGNGTYTGATTVTKAAGIYSLKITGESRDGAILTQSGSNYTLDINGTPNVIISNLSVDGGTAATIRVNNSTACDIKNVTLLASASRFVLIAGGSAGTTVDSCIATVTSTFSCIDINTASNTTIKGNTLRVNKGTAGNVDCISGYGLSGTMLVEGNDLGNTLGRYLFYTGNLNTMTLLEFKRNIFRATPNEQVNITSATGSECQVDFINNLFMNNGTKNNVLFAHASCYFLNNTFARETQTAGCINGTLIDNWRGFKNNIVAGGASSSTLITLAFNNPDVALSPNTYFKSDYNLFYRGAGNAYLLSGTLGTFSDVGALHNVGSDLNSRMGDPLFTNGAGGTSTYYLTVDSPAHNTADYTLTTNGVDIRNYFRQDKYTDIGCYDIDGNAVAKAPDDIILYKGVIRRNDGAEFVIVQLAVQDTNYNLDEDVYLDITSSVTGSNWIQSMNTKPGRMMYVQPHSSMTGKVTIKDGTLTTLKVATSVEGISNVYFKNIIFDGANAAGEPGLAALSLALGGSNNLVFDNCEFRNGQHACYIYTAGDITFKDCSFYNFWQYGVFGQNVKNFYFLGCSFAFGNYALHPEKVIDGNPVQFFASSNINFKGCTFTGDPLTKTTVKIQDCDHVSIERCVLENNGTGHVLVVGNNKEFNTEGLKINNNIFRGNGTGVTSYPEIEMINISKMTDIEFMNNTIIDNSANYKHILYTGATIEKIKYCNNLFVHPATGSSTGNLANLNIAPGLVSDNIISNNLYATNPDTHILYIRGGGYVSKYCYTVAEANSVGAETSSVKNTTLLTTANYLTAEVPFSGSLAATMGRLDLAPVLDKLNNLVGSTVSVGANYYGATPYVTPSGASFNHQFHNYIDGDLPKVYPMSVLSLDKNAILVDSPQKDELYKIKICEVTPQVTFTSVVNITTIDPEQTSSMRVGTLTGDYEEALSGVISVHDVSDGTAYLIDFVLYNDVSNITYVAVTGVIPSAITIEWDKVLTYGIGFSLKVTAPTRDKTYRVESSRVVAGIAYLTEINPYFTTLQARTKAVYKASNNIIYLGDPVVITDYSLEADTVLYEVTGGGLTYTGNVREFTLNPTTAGEVTIKLTTNNSSNIPSIKEVAGIVKVLEVPSYPVINFDTNKQILHKDETLIVSALIDINSNLKVTRFNKAGMIFKWNIIKSDTGIVAFTYEGTYLSIPLSTFDLGSYDIELRAYDAEAPAVGKSLLERRYLTVLPSLATGTKHFINCALTDSWVDGTTVIPKMSVIDGTRTTGVLNTELIQPGDIIVLSGVAQQFRAYNLHGTAEAPITIIAEGTDVFTVLSRSYVGFFLWTCSHVILSGARNYQGIARDFSILLTTDMDPRYYGKTPANQLLSIGMKSTDIRVCQIKLTNSKFDCISGKNNPEANDPSTWRNDATGGFVFNHLNIHHCLLKDSLGEGVYLGYFDTSAVGQALNSSGVMQYYYPSIMKNTKVFRNTFSSNGFDAIQMSNTFEGAEIHHNTVMNSGWRNVFGQNSGISANYIVGDIYSNDLDNLIAFQITQARTRIFNNIINTVGKEERDAIYFFNKHWPHPLWDVSVVPPVVLDLNYSGYNTKIDIFNNVIKTTRNPITVNCEWNFPMNTLNIVNNVICMSNFVYAKGVTTSDPMLWLSRNIYQIRVPGLPQPDSDKIPVLVTLNNTTSSDSLLPALKVADAEAGLFRITSSSPLYHTGNDLKALLADTVYRDKLGYLMPDINNKYPIGPYTFDDFNTFLELFANINNNYIENYILHNSIFFGKMVSGNKIQEGFSGNNIKGTFLDNNIGKEFKNNQVGEGFNHISVGYFIQQKDLASEPELLGKSYEHKIRKAGNGVILTWDDEIGDENIIDL